MFRGPLQPVDPLPTTFLHHADHALLLDAWIVTKLIPTSESCSTGPTALLKDRCGARQQIVA